MRPKKVVLLVHPDDAKLSVASFILETAGFRALAAQTDAYARTLLGSKLHIDVVAASFELGPGESTDLLKYARKVRPDTRTLLTSDRATSVPSYFEGDAWLNQHTCSAELIEKLRTLCARKRGPKKAVRPEQVAA